MSAMPERVWVSIERDGVLYAWYEEGIAGDVPYVPESRLRAAEARVREVEADVKAAQELEQLHLQNLDSAYAERDALRDALLGCVKWMAAAADALDFAHDDYGDALTQARAILAREGA